MPSLAKKCINSWRKYCPDYKIKEWNESNYDVNCCEYSRNAFSEKKWAFVSDVARYKILYEYGGFYFDTDVEIIRSLDDLLSEKAFLGIETQINESRNLNLKNCWLLNPGLAIGAEKGNQIIKNLFDDYGNRMFNVNENICDYSSEFFYHNGMISENAYQNILGVHLFPKEYFNPMDHDTGKISVTQKTYSIHHYSASWTSKSQRRNLKIFQLLNRFLGTKFTMMLKFLYGKIH